MSTPEQQQANAWLRVVDQLNISYPGWIYLEDTAAQSAVQAIKDLTVIADYNKKNKNDTVSTQTLLFEGYVSGNGNGYYLKGNKGTSGSLPKIYQKGKGTGKVNQKVKVFLAND